jgi:hypothetical protein
VVELAASEPATQGDVLLMAALSLVAGLATFVVPDRFKAAGVRFQYRLLGRRPENEERAVRRGLVLYKVAGAVFIAGGIALLVIAFASF